RRYPNRAARARPARGRRAARSEAQKRPGHGQFIARDRKTVNPDRSSGVYRAMRTHLPVHDPPVAYATPMESGPTDPVPAALPAESIDLTVVNIDPPRDFEAFYREGYADIARALTATLGDFDLAQEATDEAMVRAYVRWEKIR